MENKTILEDSAIDQQAFLKPNDIVYAQVKHQPVLTSFKVITKDTEKPKTSIKDIRQNSKLAIIRRWYLQDGNHNLICFDKTGVNDNVSRYTKESLQQKLTQNKIDINIPSINPQKVDKLKQKYPDYPFKNARQITHNQQNYDLYCGEIADSLLKARLGNRKVYFQKAINDFDINFDYPVTTPKDEQSDYLCKVEPSITNPDKPAINSKDIVKMTMKAQAHIKKGQISGPILPDQGWEKAFTSQKVATDKPFWIDQNSVVAGRLSSISNTLINNSTVMMLNPNDQNQQMASAILANNFIKNSSIHAYDLNSIGASIVNSSIFQSQPDAKMSLICANLRHNDIFANQNVDIEDSIIDNAKLFGSQDIKSSALINLASTKTNYLENTNIDSKKFTRKVATSFNHDQVRSMELSNNVLPDIDSEDGDLNE